MSDTLLGQPNLPGNARVVGDTGRASDRRPEGTASASRILDPAPECRPGNSVGHASEAAPSLEWREADTDLIRRYRRLATFAGIAVTAIGVVALIGWFGGVPMLTSLRASWVAMKANTAVGLVASGSALLLSMSGRRIALRVARLCAGFVTVLALASLAEYGSGWSFGLDQLLVTEPPTAIATTHPGRMAIVTAANFVFCGLALLRLDSRRKRWAWLPSVLALPVWVISAVAVLGYAFGSEELYTFAGNITAIAAPTAAAFVVLSTGIVFFSIEDSVLYWLASPRSGGVMLRRLLPLGILLPVLIVWLRLIGQASGLFVTSEFGAATVAVAMMVSMSCALLWCAAVLDRLDRERLSGEEQIRRLNVVLRQRVGVLEVANKELEGFSYSTSHVLRTPLRAIDGFCRILFEDYSNKLDGEGKRLLGVVRSSAQEMADLIDGILGFLRLGRDQMSIGPIDMAASVRSALQELEPKTRGRRLKIEIAPLPGAFGDAAMIQRVWTNLLDNAVKFTAPKAHALVQVGALAGDDETIYYVRDDGVGFDMQFAGKLFGVFNRLHGSEFVGNGMGLAIVQRVVSRHGGRVWAEGKPDQGATFYFSLPTKEIVYG